MKKIIKKLFPKTAQNIIHRYLNNRIIQNYFKKKYNKNALLSYIVAPFIKGTISFSHTNFYEAMSWAKILDELGYNVDIVDYRSNRDIGLSKYDLIAGFGDIFQKYFESNYNKRVVTIYYGTGMHVCHQNTATLKRVKDVFMKKGVWLGKSARFVEKTWTHQTLLVDGMVILGNEVSAESYSKYYDGPIYYLGACFYETQNAENIIKQRSSSSKTHYLWFGSSGLIHKGLDLCLDYFSKNQKLFLHICGTIENEKEFVNVYKNQLYDTPNIKVHSFVDITSEEFKNILLQCSFVIFPSCSEGGCPSILTAIGNGGLIPIITRGTTVETGYEIWIDGYDYKSIDKAVKKSQSLSFNEIKSMQYNNLHFVKVHHSQENYYKKLKEYICIIINKTK